MDIEKIDNAKKFFRKLQLIRKEINYCEDSKKNFRDKTIYDISAQLYYQFRKLISQEVISLIGIDNFQSLKNEFIDKIITELKNRQAEVEKEIKEL